MEERIGERLAQLRAEAEKGQARLRQIQEAEDVLRRERIELQATMLRISGAAQVLEEMLASEA